MSRCCLLLFVVLLVQAAAGGPLRDEEPTTLEDQIERAIASMSAEEDELRQRHPDVLLPTSTPGPTTGTVLDLDRAAQRLGDARVRVALGVPEEDEGGGVDARAIHDAAVGYTSLLLHDLEERRQAAEAIDHPAPGPALDGLLARLLPMFEVLGNQEFHVRLIDESGTAQDVPRLVRQVAYLESRRALLDHLPQPSHTAAPVLDPGVVWRLRDAMPYPRDGLDLDVSLPHEQAERSAAAGEHLSALAFSFVALRGHIHSEVRDQGLRDMSVPEERLDDAYRRSLDLPDVLWVAWARELVHGLQAQGDGLPAGARVTVTADAVSWLEAWHFLRDPQTKPESAPGAENSEVSGAGAPDTRTIDATTAGWAAALLGSLAFAVRRLRKTG